MIQFTNITLQSDRRWRFTWDATSQDFKIVLAGRTKSTVPNPDSGPVIYIFDGMGPYSIIPPPIEAVPVGEYAESEVDVPFLRIQWYADPSVTRYEFLEYVSGNWVVRGWAMVSSSSVINSITTNPLHDEREYSFRIINYNASGEASDPLEINVFTGSHPIFDDSNIVVEYNETTNAIDIIDAS